LTLICALGLFNSTEAAASVSPKKTPGKIGVYCKLMDVFGSPTDLSRTMTEIKASGVEFILPLGITSPIYATGSRRLKKLVAF
jgi:hypothetical protein